MFGSNYFGAPYFAQHYAGSHAATATVTGVDATTALGSVLASGTLLAAGGGAGQSAAIAHGRVYYRPAQVVQYALAQPEGVAARTRLGKVHARGESRVRPAGVEAATHLGIAAVRGVRNLTLDELALVLLEAA